MPDISDPKTAFTPGRGASGIDTHDESYAAQRPDGQARAQQGGNSDAEYIRVDNNDNLHFANMMSTTVDPLVERLRREIDAIPAVECGTFPHGEDLTKAVARFKEDYSKKCDEIDRATTGLSNVSETVGRKYGITDDSNVATAGEVGGALADTDAAVASMGRPGMPGEPTG
jgi:hypothetical protein